MREIEHCFPSNHFLSFTNRINRPLRPLFQFLPSVQFNLLICNTNQSSAARLL
ncbi:hypothetical protein ZOSMA_71G00130 [Zostera marina]|uniref:Uncharacterized protein n=1 Tax=Zostera marina TaxID=29655 RepID=A0A0K9NSH3_ZOSMR|nr:hypothetical protein ZOSMA_71G00130 [Zostera marina]